MRTKDELLEKFTDQLAGFLLAGFMENDKGDMAMKARYMQNKLAKVRPLLEEMFRFITEEPPPAKPLTLDEELALMIKRINSVAPERREALVDMCRKGFTVNGKPQETKTAIDAGKKKG